jgi:hypothetical protein
VQNNTLAVLHDLAPADRQSSIIETMVTNPHWDVTPWFMHFVFEAFDHAGVFGKFGVAKMHEFKIAPETQTVQEAGTGKGDYSHGWVASPTYQMSSKILGITPTSPGFATLAIRPTLCGLQFASGTVPTPHGDIHVDWQRQPDQLTLKVTIPRGTEGTVDVPVGSAPQPTLLSGDKVIWDGDHPGEKVEGVKKIIKTEHAIELLVRPGTYELAAKRLLPDVP